MRTAAQGHEDKRANAGNGQKDKREIRPPFIEWYCFIKRCTEDSPAAHKKQIRAELWGLGYKTDLPTFLDI